MKGFLRTILLLLPREFRVRHGSDLIDLYRDLYWKERAFRRTRFVVDVVRDAILTALAVRLDSVRSRLRHRKTTLAPVPSGESRKRASRGSGGVDGWIQDVRLAARSLWRTPGFTLAAVGILALGIGANTTVYCALKAALFAAPPFKGMDRLVVPRLKRIRAGEEMEMGEGPWWSNPAFDVLRGSLDRLIDQVANYKVNRVTLSGHGLATEIEAEIVAPEYFPVLGIRTRLGRVFLSTEADPATPTRVTILSHAFWISMFGGDASVLGQTLVLNGNSYEVVGVAPPGFAGLTGRAQVWVPTAATGDFMPLPNLQRGHNQVWYVVGRLRPEVPLEEAEAWIRALGRRIDAEYPFGADIHYVGEVRPLQEVWQNPRARTSVLLLAASALLVLIVACVDLSGLLIARHQRRSRDNGVRLAVGASRWYLVRAWLVECLMLSGLGGVAGLVLAYLGAGVLRTAWPGQFLDSPEGGLRVVDLGALSVDTAVLGYALAAVALVAALVGLLPALRASGAHPAENLKVGLGASRRPARILGIDSSQCLVAVQVAMALTLVIGAGLLADSVRRLLEVPEGFRTGNLLTFHYRPPEDWPAGAQASFDDDMMARLAALPGVMGLTRGCIPVRDVCSVSFVEGIDGRSEDLNEQQLPEIAVSAVDDRYFEVLELSVLKGRGLDRRDGVGSQPTAVLNETAAYQYFHGADPLGHWIQIRGTDFEVVGVAARVLHGSPDHVSMPEVYVSNHILPDARGVIVRTSVKPTSLLPAIRRSIGELNSEVVLTRVATMDDLIAATTGDRRMILSLLAAFSLVALLLVSVGTWAVVARSVVDHRREIGVRLAFGAVGRQVLLPVLGQGPAMALAGLGVGLALSWNLAPILEPFLYGATARDPAVYGFGGTLLLAVVALASYLPVRRALRTDPLESLRAE